MAARCFASPTLKRSPALRLLFPSSLPRRPLSSPPQRTLISLPKFFGVPPQRRRRSVLARFMGTDGSRGEVVVPRSVPVRVAHELLQAGHRYLDVRTVDEFSAGHPVGATNIPYMLKAGSGLTRNPNFLEEVFSVFGKDDEIIIPTNYPSAKFVSENIGNNREWGDQGCQSGRRSLMAATDLASAGFTGITDIAGGYSAWVQNGLPIDQ